MIKITERQKARIRTQVRKEFPGDEMMQEIHYIRGIHYLQTKDLSPAEQIRFYQRYKKRKRNAA